jgi:hypothetical protein
MVLSFIAGCSLTAVVFYLLRPKQQDDRLAKIWATLRSKTLGDNDSSVSLHDRGPPIIDTTDTLLNLRDAFNNDESFPDFKFIFPHSRQTLLAHRFVLSVNSDLFQVHMNQQESPNEMVIDQDDEKMFRMLIASFYTGSLQLECEESAVPMFVLASKYEITSVERGLLSYLIDNISMINALSIWRMVDKRNDKFKELLEKVKVYMNANAVNILAGDEVLGLDYEVFSKLLSVLSNKKTIVHVYNALQKWVEKDEEHRTEHTMDLVKLVNKSTVSATASWVFEQATLPAQVEANGKKVVCMGHVNYNGAVFIDEDISEIRDTKVEWKFKINTVTTWIALGVAHKAGMIEKRPQWTHSAIGHYAYLLACSGYTYSHNMVGYNSKGTGMTFHNGDVITIIYDKMERTLTFEKHGQKVIISGVPQEVHPVVMVMGAGDSVTLME